MILCRCAKNHPHSWNWRLAARRRGAAGLGGCAGHDRGKPAVVCTSPIDPPAPRAAGELVVGPACTWQEILLDVAFRRGGESLVAGDASGPRRQRGSEPVEHVGELVVSARRTWLRGG